MLKDLSKSKKTGIKVVYESFKILNEAGGELTGKEVMEKISQRIEFSDWEKEISNKTGYIRWQTFLGFFLIDSVKAGFLIKKDGTRTLTEEGKRAIDLGPIGLFERANEAYKEWAETTKEDDENTEQVKDEIGEEVKLEDFDLVGFCKEIDIENISNMTFHSLGDPERIKINAIISDCHKTNRVLPNFQRYFDWNKDRIKGLLESIFKDYYVGSFLLWKSRKSEVGVQAILGVKKEEIDQTHIILDGQQRMTSLYYAIKAPNIPLKRQNKPTYFYINFHNFLINNGDKEIIEYHDRKIIPEDTYKKLLFPMYELEDYNKWLEGLDNFMIDRINLDTDTLKKWNKIRNVINNKLKHIRDGFEIPYISLPETMKLYQVSDIFEQINTKGKPLTIFDLLIARLYKYNIELRELRDMSIKTHDNIHRYYKEGKIDKMPIYILQTMSLLYEKNSSTKKQDVLDIYSKIYENKERDFEIDREESSKYTDIAIERLENLRYGYGVKDERELPFEPMIPVLSALLKLVDDRQDKIDCYKKIDKWYWASIFTNAYSFSADSQKTSDFKELKKWFDDNSFKPRFMEMIEREVNGLYLLDVQKNRSAKYRGVMSLLAIEGAKDFYTAQSLENARKNQKDHIFPKVFHSEDGSHKNINSVLNMTRLSSSTNQSKQDKAPSVYLPRFISEKYNGNENEFRELLKTHFIDNRTYDALVSDNLQRFMEIREKNIVDKIKEVVGLPDTSNIETLIVPDKKFSNEMAFVKMIKSCDEYICFIDKYFSEAGFEFLLKGLDDGNIKNIRIVMSPDKADTSFIKTFKKFKDEVNKDKGISCEIKVITDKRENQSIHDRFLVSKYSAYNIPSPDTIKRGQLSEITESRNKDQLYKIFNKIRNNSKDINNIHLK